MINLHIIGVQKAGTTALASFLAQHPAIYVVDGKEAHVFDHPLYAEQTNKAAFANKKYQGKLSNYQNQRIICDATPITIFRDEYLQACYQYNPAAKFILILRHPVERAVSHFHMSSAKGVERRTMFMAFISENFRLKKLNKLTSWPFDSAMREHSYLSRGLYKKQLKSLFRIIPKEQVLVLQQHELQHNHQKTMLEIFEFLDIHRIDIEPKKIFPTNKLHSHWSDSIAKLYAHIYFYLRN